MHSARQSHSAEALHTDVVGLTTDERYAADPGAGPAILLVDEAAAHLDAARRAALFEELLDGPGQAWLTGTDGVLFEAFGGRAQRVPL